MKKILLLILLAFASYSVVGEPTGPSKKCPICGQPIPKCKYKGKHPKTATQNTSDQKHKPDTEAKRKAEADAKRKREAEAKQRQEAEAQRQREAKMINGHEWVDLGLSVKWASCNVGADSPSEYGDFFAWGETKPKSSYTESNYTINGVYNISGDPQYDAASANWGDKWRMPSDEEFKELANKCEWFWTSINGINGFRVKGPNGNELFLPAGGMYGKVRHHSINTEGCYWTNTPRGGSAGLGIRFDETGYRGTNGWSAYQGCSIRAVAP